MDLFGSKVFAHSKVCKTTNLSKKLKFYRRLPLDRKWKHTVHLVGEDIKTVVEKIKKHVDELHEEDAPNVDIFRSKHTLQIDIYPTSMTNLATELFYETSRVIEDMFPRATLPRYEDNLVKFLFENIKKQKAKVFLVEVGTKGNMLKEFREFDEKGKYIDGLNESFAHIKKECLIHKDIDVNNKVELMKEVVLYYKEKKKVDYCLGVSDLLGPWYSHLVVGKWHLCVSIATPGDVHTKKRVAYGGEWNARHRAVTFGLEKFWYYMVPWTVNPVNEGLLHHY